MNIIQATEHYSDEECTERFAATLLTDSDYDLVVQDDALVLKPDGSPLLIYRKNVIPAEYCKAAFPNLRQAALEHDSSNRGMASGKGKIEGADVGSTSDTRVRVKKADGSLSNTNRALMSDVVGKELKRVGGKLLMQQSDGSYVQREARDVNSAIVGFVDSNPRFPYCRLTAFNINHPEMFNASLPLIRRVNDVFREALPERWQNQKRIVEQSSPDFYISGTVFTTITVNLNFQTAVHKDAGDLKEGFGVMAALRAGHYEGCYTCFPKYRVAVDMQTGGVCLADVHEWHGNTPVKAKSRYERISLIFYYREKIKNCGSADEELMRAKANKGVTHLPGWRA